MNDGNEWLEEPDPPGVQSLTSMDHVNIVSCTAIVEDVLKAMLDDVGDSFNVASVFEPFQVLLRQIMTAAVSYYAMQGSAELAAIARELLESGRLDSPSVARAPSAQEVTGLVMELADWDREKFTHERAEVTAKVQAVVADAMDCAYKQAIAAPQTVGSRFGRS